jgi:hypothetical protein
MDLKNLIDQAATKQMDLKHLNDRIEKEKKDLQYLEMTLKVDQAMNDLDNYPEDFKNSLKTSSRERLKVLYNDMSDEEINVLYDRTHNMK